MVNLQIKQLHLVRLKQLKGGRKVVRNQRTIDCAKTKIEGKSITVDFDHRWAAGQMVGEFDQAKGSLTLNVKSLELRGYLQFRKFQLIGYTPAAQMTNLNRRKEPKVLKAPVTKGPAVKGRKW